MANNNESEGEFFSDEEFQEQLEAAQNAFLNMFDESTPEEQETEELLSEVMAGLTTLGDWLRERGINVAIFLHTYDELTRSPTVLCGFSGDEYALRGTIKELDF
jgi:hypothetical protein